MGDQFIENRGQVDDQVLYYATGSRASVYFTHEALVIDLKEESEGGEYDPLARFARGASRNETDGTDAPSRKGCAIYIYFEGANPFPRINARGDLPGAYHFIRGDDPLKWRSGVRASSEVVYQELWPGVDLVYRIANGNLTYEIVTRGGGAHEEVRFRHAGGARRCRDP